MRKDVTGDPAVAADILHRAELLHLALCDAQGPLAVTVNFVLHQGLILIHSSFKGRKAAALAAGTPLAFCAQVDVELKPGDMACAWGYRFRSVMGSGRAEALADPALKAQALHLITAKYADAPSPLDEKIVAKTAVFAIQPQTMTARIKGYDEAYPDGLYTEPAALP